LGTVPTRLQHLSGILNILVLITCTDCSTVSDYIQPELSLVDIL